MRVEHFHLEIDSMVMVRILVIGDFSAMIPLSITFGEMLVASNITDELTSRVKVGVERHAAFVYTWV